MKDLLNTVERIWCETMHDRVMWPIHGRYLCSTCLREYPAAFDLNAETRRTQRLRGESHSEILRVASAHSASPR
jgi:hypothetical protein